LREDWIRGNTAVATSDDDGADHFDINAESLVGEAV